jgi:hypothetical protein
MLEWGGGRTPQEWRALIKKVACYADGLGPRLYGADLKYRHSGTEIASLALGFVREGRTGYVFRHGHGLTYDFLCHACLRTARALQRAGIQDAASQLDIAAIEAALAHAGDDDTPVELSEGFAVQLLERRKCLEAFLAFVKGKKLRGKQRAYGLGFPKYGADGWDAERIAKDLRVTSSTVGTYRAQLRDYLEEFEVDQERRGGARAAGT